jgi:SNF2 family DNA or RNA helicase
MVEYRDDFDISTDEDEGSRTNSRKSSRKIVEKNSKKINDSQKIYRKDYKVPVIEKPIIRIWQSEVEKILAIRYSTTVNESGGNIINMNKRECLLKFVGQSYRSIAWEDEKDVLEDTTGAYKHKLYVRMKAKKEEPLYVGEDFLFEHVVDLEWFDCERIISSKIEDVVYETETLQEESYLVKWKGLPYNESTWEFIAELEENESEIQQYRDNQSRLLKLNNNIASKKTKVPDASFNKLVNLKTLFESGDKLSVNDIPVHDISLRDYQVEAVNWLLYMYANNRSCILADEMGLGKTIQSCSFLETLREKGYSTGVSMVIAPLSTIKFWQSTFAENTKSNVVLFYGSCEERNYIKDYEFSENPNYKNQSSKKNNNDLGIWLPHFNVMITTYEVCQNDSTFLKKFNWDVVVIDEAHRLKNNKTQIRTTLLEFNIKHKVLLTGTPIQNNMAELFSLLEFMDPKEFKNRNDLISKYTDMQTETQVNEVLEILRKYMLRREKKDVEILLPKKIETIIDVELTAYQKQYYRAILEKNRKFLMRGKLKKLPQLLNVLSELRKVCNHPFLVVGGREHYYEEQIHQKQLEKQQANSSGVPLVEEEISDITDPINSDPLIFCSGKIVLLHKLLIKLKAEGSKALIFSQFTSTLDLIQDFLANYDYEYERIDGSVTGRSRFAAMKRFNAENSTSLVFLLTTRAGGIGLNLQSANTVIIFDSDWNPQGDHQAIARSHRMGQKKDVKVYRLLSKKTAEQELFKAANLKLGLTNVLLNGLNKEKASSVAKDERSIDDILKNGAFELLAEDEATSLAQSKKFMTDNIDLILEANAKEITYTDEGYVPTQDYEKKVVENDNEDKKEKSLFSQVSFVSDKTSENINLDDLDFWEKALPTGNSRISRLKKVYDEDNMINLKNDTNYSRVTLISVLKIAEEINNLRQAGEMSDETDEIVELLTILISSCLYTGIENEILSLRMSIEQPKRHRSYNNNTLLSESAIKKLNNISMRNNMNNNNSISVGSSSGEESNDSDVDNSDNSGSYSDAGSDGDDDEYRGDREASTKSPHYNKSRTNAKKLTDVEIETNNVIVFLLNDLDPKTDKDLPSKQEQVSVSSCLYILFKYLFITYTNIYNYILYNSRVYNYLLQLYIIYLKKNNLIQVLQNSVNFVILCGRICLMTVAKYILIEVVILIM